MIELWTDGACQRNPHGPGGWAVVVVEDGRAVAEHSGHEAKTTNNRMEMTAALEALRHLAPGEAATINTDSQLLVNGATQWLTGWKRKGWKKADGQPVLNTDLWQAIDAEMQRVKTARWNWVRGHAGNRWNERADQLAVLAAATGKGTSRTLDGAPPAAGGGEPMPVGPPAQPARPPASAARAAQALLALRAATAAATNAGASVAGTGAATATAVSAAPLAAGFDLEAALQAPAPPVVPDGGSFAGELAALRELERFVRAASAGGRVPEQLAVLLGRVDAARRARD